MGVTEQLATFLARTSYDDLPRRAVEVAKERILDTVGVALAGSRDSSGLIATSLVKEWGGTPVSVVIGGGFRTSAPNAALANGTSAHALDFDDRTIPVNHFNAALVPSLLSLADAIGASGRKVIESYVLGYEVGTRIGAGFSLSHYFKLGWHPPNSWGALGTTAACAKLLDLSVAETRMALGIASSAAGGIRKNYGTNTNPLHCGYAARNGVVAAQLAQRGFTANMDVLDQAPEARPTAHMYFSFPQVFCGTGNYDLARMVADLGETYQLAIAPPTIKLHPGPVSTGNFIDLVFEAMRKYRFAATDVARVECHVTKAYVDAASAFPNPTCPDEARYSLQYQLAVALLDGNVGIDQHAETRISQPDVREMMTKIKLTERPDAGIDTYDLNFKQMELPKVTFALKNGRELTAEQEVPHGDQDPPLSHAEILAKYRDCSERAIDKAATERSIALIDGMEKLTNISEFMAVLM